jgi:hypothetical protein
MSRQRSGVAGAKSNCRLSDCDIDLKPVKDIEKALHPWYGSCIMDTPSNVLLMIPASPAWAIPAAAQDISGWLIKRGFSLEVERKSGAGTLTLRNPETTHEVKLIITTTECVGHLKYNHVLDVVLVCREEIDAVLSRLIERLEQLRLLTMPIASHADDEDILLRRLADLGYL